MTSIDGKGYAIPDPPSPYELICFRVFVPKHFLYIGAFWQAYEFFTSWIAWWRDPLKRGKQAAAIWRTAYDKAWALYQLTKGQCEMNVTGVRQNPNNKCELQIEFDGSNEWQTVADFSDCGGGSGGGAMQFDGVNISIYNDCTGEFEPTGTPYNPITSNIYDSLYSPDTQGRCNGAANIAQWSKYVSDNSLSLFATAGVAGAAVSFILGTLASIAGAGFLTESLIASLLAQFVSEGDLFSDAAAIDISAELQNILYGFMDDDGTIREPNFTEAITTLYARRDEETPDTAERVRWGHEVNILSALGPSVVSRQNKYAGITDADCSTAGWVQVFDFTTARQGWVRRDPPGTWVSGQRGVYQLGDGWKSDLSIDNFDGHWRIVSIGIGMSPATITDVKAYYDANLGINTASDTLEKRLMSWRKETGGGESTIDSTETIDGENVYHWSGSESGTILLTVGAIAGHDSVDPETDPGGDVTISKIVLAGTGTNPFQ